MPAGSFDLSGGGVSTATMAYPIYVARYQPGSPNAYTLLSNVRCLRIDYREGPTPPLARFAYVMDDLIDGALGWPSQFERLWPIDAQGDYVVLSDDRLVVLTEIPSSFGDDDPQTIVLFDGFAQVPQVDISAQKQSVTFVAQGVAIRLWDHPILGRKQRNGDSADITTGDEDVFVDLPARFNPADSSVGAYGGYAANCVGLDFFTKDDDGAPAFPVFIDPVVIQRLDPEIISYWYIVDVCKYLIGVEKSPVDDAGEPYVIYPTYDSLDDVLGTYAPPDDGTLNASSATLSNCKVRDYDASNKSVPDVFAEMLRYGGFTMVYEVSTSDSGTPQTHLRIKRRDGLSTQAPKQIFLAADGSESLDMASNNATAIHLARDANDIVNAWDVEMNSDQIEITVSLAPGFEPVPGDEGPSQLAKWMKANLANATDKERRMYRWWVADECADGHFDMGTRNWVTDKPLDLSELFPGTEATSNSDGTETPASPGYCKRYRPGSKTLIAKDKNGKPLKAVLQVSTSDGPSGDPALISAGSTVGATLVTMPEGSWELLDDRLGVKITIDNPNNWISGTQKSLTGGEKIASIRLVDWVAPAAVPTGGKDIILLLTTVIESDQRGSTLAGKRLASPTQFARKRTIDGRDHFQYAAINKSSIYYDSQINIDGETSNGTDDLVLRDDGKAAKTHAEQLRAAHEFPTLAGSVTIPTLTDHYLIGDRIEIIAGRNASLQVNVGVDQGEAPTYPWVTAFAWDFTGDAQRTIIQFSDRRAEPQGV